MTGWFMYAVTQGELQADPTDSVATHLVEFSHQLSISTKHFASAYLLVYGITKMGLDAGLNYRDHPEWHQWALEQTGGEGVDLVVEVGGLGTLPRSLKAVRTGGTIAQIGVLSEAVESIPLGMILHKVVRIQGIYVGSRSDFMEMNKAITFGQIRPVGEDFHWTQAREVLVKMEEGSHFGKLVLTVG